MTSGVDPQRTSPRIEFTSALPQISDITAGNFGDSRKSGRKYAMYAYEPQTGILPVAFGNGMPE